MNNLKLLIFDLDGVLVETKIIHFKSLNLALSKIGFKEIEYDEHLKRFDGLPTAKKIEILLKEKRINKKNISKINALKQNYTKKLLNKELKFNQRLFNLFKKLSKKYTLVVATNAIKSTLDICLKKLKINEFISQSFSNEDVEKPKPHPLIYMKIMVENMLSPDEVLIFEDSYFGRNAATLSGAHLYPVKDLSDISLKKIYEFMRVNKMQNKNINNQKWTDESLNILIPMAGEGSRFKEVGYTFPKPIIEVKGKPMIQLVVENLNIKANYIFIIRKDHQKKFNIKSLLSVIQPNCKIVEVDELTEGAACTALLAKKYINNNNPLLIANSDQYIKWDSSKTMYNFISKKIDGGILTFESVHPKWSYAKIDKNEVVTEVAEKKVISNNATVGIYYWSKGNDFVKYANQMIKKNIRTNNEFYICPVFNEAIKAGKVIKSEKIEKMQGLGTPEDLDNFLLEYKNAL